eukprot:1054730-Prorocentrum_minimum.AAC.1
MVDGHACESMSWGPRVRGSAGLRVYGFTGLRVNRLEPWYACPTAAGLRGCGCSRPGLRGPRVCGSA